MTIESIRSLLNESDRLLRASFDKLRDHTPEIASSLLVAFDDPTVGMQWMNRSNAYLDGRKPVDLIEERLESELLEFLLRIQYGVDP